MIKYLTANRFTARHWNTKAVEQEKINYILDCAYNAPSKQSIYPYTIHVLTNSSEAANFKEWLYWHDTWCVEGIRANPTEINSNNKTFNGQYRAPLVLLYSHRDLDPNNHNDAHYWKQYNAKINEGKRQQNLIDMTVSASFAMLAAEELGLRTGLGCCHSDEYVDSILGKGSIKVGIVLGIGYAEPDSKEQLVNREPIYKDSVLQGHELKNLPQTFPIENHFFRRRKPSKDELIKII